MKRIWFLLALLLLAALTWAGLRLRDRQRQQWAHHPEPDCRVSDHGGDANEQGDVRREDRANRQELDWKDYLLDEVCGSDERIWN